VRCAPTTIDAIVVTGADAVVYAHAGTLAFRLDLHDGGDPGIGDTFRIRAADRYDSGVLTRVTGNLKVHDK